MNKHLRRLGAMSLAGAVIFGGLSVATAAQADVISGTITLYGASTDGGATRGPAITSGNASDTRMFYGISINGRCPAGFQQGSQTYAFQNGTLMGGLSTARDGSVTLYGDTGLGNADVNMSDANNTGFVNPYVNSRRLNQLTTPLATGNWEIRYYCHAAGTASPDFVNDKWFALPMQFNAATGAWATGSIAAAEATTVSLTAGVNPDKSVTLTGTVKNSSNATATAAAGSVEFFAADGTTSVGTGAVSNGVATFTTGVLPAGTYGYTAKFVTTNAATFTSSPLSGVANVTVPGDNTQSSTITVSIPAGIGTLTLSGVPTTVPLGTATLGGGTLNASGNLNGVTVTDTRQLDAPNWSLTGQVGNFTAGAKTLLAKYLGWKPVAASGPGVAGAEVLPAATDGLSVVRTLGTGAVTDGQPVTVFNTQLNLKAPANTPAGAYSATLTITLA